MDKTSTLRDNPRGLSQESVVVQSHRFEQNRVWDALIVGAGHNGLTCAAYLARAGLDVAVLERREVLGGASATEEVWPGYQISTTSYAAGLISQQIVDELELPRFGYRVTAPDAEYFAPYADGSSLTIWGDVKRTVAEMEQIAPRDAATFPAFAEHLARIAGMLRQLFFTIPPRIAAGDVAHWLRLAGKLRGWRVPEIVEITRLFTMSADDYLDDWFEDDRIKALIATQGIIGAWAGPMTPGTAYVLLHHWMGEAGDKAWGWVHGGMGGLSKAIAGAAEAAGARVVAGAPVAQIAVDRGRAYGVVLADGQELRARAVVSGAHPKTTFLDLVGERNLDAEVVKQIRRYRTRSGAVKLNWALDGLPDVPAAAAKPAVKPHGTMLGIAPDIRYLERAWDDAKHGRPSSRPFVEVFFPSVFEPGIAPPGKHVSLAFAQYLPYDVAEGTYAQARETFASSVVDVIDEVAPGFRGLIAEQQVLGPRELEETYGLVGGNIFHGEMTPDQMFLMRPLPNWGNYATPVEGLYLCGSGTHPGGGVTGVPGRNCATELLRRRPRWRRGRRG
jgi:phytoene dehydrogenase-like protein